MDYFSFFLNSFYITGGGVHKREYKRYMDYELIWDACKETTFRHVETRNDSDNKMEDTCYGKIDEANLVICGCKQNAHEKVNSNDSQVEFFEEKDKIRGIISVSESLAEVVQEKRSEGLEIEDLVEFCFKPSGAMESFATEKEKNEFEKELDTEHALHMQDIEGEDNCENEGETISWNEAFQVGLEEFFGERRALKKMELVENLRALVQTFNITAESIARVLIQEVHLPEPLKTIKPLDSGGVAGGMKFRRSNIFFKFALDWKGLYGDDKASMHVAGLELLSLNYLVEQGIKHGFCMPLVAIIDWRGYRIECTSVLPINESTLVYGCANASRLSDGVPIMKSDPYVNEQMKKLAQALNLKEHIVGMHTKTELYWPIDIEVCTMTRNSPFRFPLD